MNSRELPNSGEIVISKDLIEKKLSPSVEQDNANFSRKIFRFNNISFSFRGAEEAPLYPTLQSGNTQFLGDMPHFMSHDEYQQYKKQLQTNNESPLHLNATKTPLGVIEVALQLGGNSNQKLINLRNKLKTRQYTPEVMDLIENLVVCNFVRDGKIVNSPDIDAEALVVLSLLGDEEAMEYVKSARKKYHKIEDEVGVTGSPEVNKDSIRTPLKIEDLAIVHATGYLPVKNEDGEYEVLTNFDATKGKVLRNTIHTTINHKVASHFFGDWSKKSYVLVSPLANMIDLNGSPANLVPWDTWWTRNPGEGLVFKGGILVQAGGDIGDDLISSRGDTIDFKSVGYAIDDIDKLINLIREEPTLKDSFRMGLRGSIGEFLSVRLNEIMTPSEQERFNKYFTEMAVKLGFDPQVGQFRVETILEKLTNSTNEIGSSKYTFNRWVEDKIEELLIPQFLDGLSDERKSELKKEAIDILENTISSWFYGNLSEYATSQAIRKQGAKPTIGTKNASHLDRSAISLIAHDIGSAIFEYHKNSPVSELEGKFLNAVNEAVTDDVFDWKKYLGSDYTGFSYNFNNTYGAELLSLVDDKTRNVLVASGYLNARA